MVLESTPVAARIACRTFGPVMARVVVNTTLPLFSSVFTPVPPSDSTTAFRSAIAMRFALPTLIPRSSAMCVAGICAS